MIPEKLYIPTSTLNFNNIMSSESISPASFYARRGFGYKRFEKVEPNKLENRIVLYDKYPKFDIDDKELENFPMVIEVSTESIKEDIIKEQNGVFYSDETIYLNPFTTKIIFRTGTEKIDTISKAEPSIETKMVPLYEKCIVTYENQNDTDWLVWEKIKIEDATSDISRLISEDRRINKLKGLLYGYLIASNKSISADIVSLKKHHRNLKNTLSAIVSSPNSRASHSQEEQLKSLYNAINDRLMNIFLAPIIKEKSEIYKCDFINMLTQEKILDSWIKQNNYSKYQVSRFYAPSNNKDKAYNTYIQDLEKQILNIEVSQNKHKVDTSSLPVFQHRRIAMIPEQKEFLVKLLNEYLEEAYNSEEFIQSRYEFAKSGGKIFKEELQDKWINSQWQQYINALLKNLNEFSALDIKSINNITLESFAAFCQKGESDIDKLEDYLILNEIGDFRIAFSLWGIIFGFSNMPKTLTNDLFQTNDYDYLTSVYKHIFNQLHGIELEGKIEKAVRPKQYTSENGIPSNYQTQSKSEQTVKNISDKPDIIGKLKDCKLKAQQLESISDIYEEYGFILNEKFFNTINKINGIGKKSIENIRKALIPMENQKIATTSTGEFDFDEYKPEIGKEFYIDKNIWCYLEPLVPTDIKKNVKKEIDWIQQVHKEKGYKKSGEWVQLSDSSNKAVIKHFENNSKNRIDIKVLEKIVEKLNELYL